jgi:cell wall-associated NlpC family hydrolase
MKSQTIEKEVQKIYEQVKMVYAPDKRTTIFNVATLVKDGNVILKGETNLKNAKLELKKKLEEMNYRIKDSIQILPAKNLGENVFGIIKLSVANLRIKPSQTEEMVTQSLLGTPIKIYKSNNGWYLIQTPDEYIAWMEDDAIQPVNKRQYDKWIKSKRIIFTSDFGFSYINSDRNSQRVSDLVKGNLLKVLEEKLDYFKVEYPDRRIAFVHKKDCEPFDKWINNIKINPENIVRTAKTFMGIPYLWGGTSVKGVDCSGFTKSVYFLNGVLLPRDASQQANVGDFVTDKIDFNKLQSGDLLFFGDKKGLGKKENIKHVGIYIGDGEFIHSSGFVKINNLKKGKKDFSIQRLNTFIRAKRIITSLDKNGVYLIINHNAYFKVDK